jgi:hypothetical protein
MIDREDHEARGPYPLANVNVRVEAYLLLPEHLVNNILSIGTL